MTSLPAAWCQCTILHVVHGQYKYTEDVDLLALEAAAPGTGPASFVPATPLVPSAWHIYLQLHLDHAALRKLHPGGSSA